jgi:biotin carboxyl carrier protein
VKRRYTVQVGERTLTIEVDGERVYLDGRLVEVRWGGRSGDVRRRLLVAGRSIPFIVDLGGRARWRLSTDGHRFDVEVLDERARAVRAAGVARDGGAAEALKAPMPGRIVRVLVAEGQAVEAGQGLVVMEAMKMENELKAAGGGTVRRVRVEQGDRVEKGALLVEMG